MDRSNYFNEEPEDIFSFDDEGNPIYEPTGIDEIDDPQGFYDEMWVPTWLEILRYDLHGFWLQIRHWVLSIVSKKYRDHFDEIPF